MEKFTTTEAGIYENIVNMVDREMKLLSRLIHMEYDDIKRLELLTKIYATLKDDLRCDVKAGLGS